jgi:branched-chain amino acid transport system permease protein
LSPVVYYFLSFTAINILMCWAFYLPYRVGQLHHLVVSCMMASAYFAGYAARQWSWPFALILLVGTAIGMLLCLIPSFAIGDAPCFTVVIVGLTVLFILKTAIENTRALGGTMGFFGIPQVNNLLPMVYLFLVLAGLLLYLIDNSRLGRAASMVFVDKDAARALGVDVKRLGMLFQIIAGGFAGLAGTLYAFLIGSLFPEFFNLGVIGTLMCMLFAGGHSTMWGVVISVPVFQGLHLILPSAVASWLQVIYAVTLIVVILVLPGGLITKRMLVKVGERFRAKPQTASIKGGVKE